MIIIVIGIILMIIGFFGFVNTAFRWGSYSQRFPLENYPKYKFNTTKYVYKEYGEKGLRKYLFFESFFFVALGILFSVVGTKDVTERVQIMDFPQIWVGDTVSFAGGELILEEVGISEGFTAKRFNLDKNRYEEVEVKADMYDESMLLFKTTLTNNSNDTISIVHEDLKCYAKPPEEGNNIKGHSVVDGYLYHDNAIELAAGESVPVWFWLSFTDEELSQFFWFVIQYDNTGCLVVPHD